MVLFNGPEILIVGVDAQVLLDEALDGGIVEFGHCAVCYYREVSLAISISTRPLLSFPPQKSRPPATTQEKDF